MFSEFADDSGIETIYETASWDNFVSGFSSSTDFA
jgi:hypothetical protein